MSKGKSVTSSKSDSTKEKVDDEIDDYAEEMFFNKDSYNSFNKKNNTPLFDDCMYIDNNLHKVNTVTPNHLRITSEVMTLAEYTRVISERAKQIEENSVKFCDIGDETDLIKIAKMEIRQKKCPINITRQLPMNIVEIFSVNELEIPFK